VLDFKKNIVIGDRPNERSCIFRKLKHRVLLGILVITKDAHHYFDHISNLKKQTAYFATECLRSTLKNFNQEIYKNLFIFVDCGNHFSSQFFLGFPLFDLVLTPWCNNTQSLVPRFSRVEVTYFEPKHGKNHCDSHFSAVSKYL